MGNVYGEPKKDHATEAHWRLLSFRWPRQLLREMLKMKSEGIEGVGLLKLLGIECYSQQNINIKFMECRQASFCLFMCLLFCSLETGFLYSRNIERGLFTHTDC